VRLDVANARVGARRARLLGRDGLLELLARGAVELQLEALRGTAAGRRITAADRSPAAAEAGLRAAVYAEAEGLLKQVEGARARRLLAAWLSLDEAEAVKAVVRGILNGERADLVLAAAPATPALGAVALRAAVATTSVDAALALLAGEANSPVAAAAHAAWKARPQARLGLLSVEVAADRAAFARARAAARGPFEDARVLAAHLADRTDARNAATLLALGDAAAPDGVLLEGGRRLDAEALGRLAHASAPERRSGIAWRLGVPPAVLASPTRADLALERGTLVPLRREARARPLSLAVPLAYLAERRAEVRRVALALRATSLGLPGDEALALVES
jgi:V/A-type H+-transporting ATPase subunit C